MRWLRTGLARTFLLSYLLVIVVGMVTLFVTTELVGPTILDQHMAQMMGQQSAGSMMGGSGSQVLPMNAQTRAAFRDAMMQAVLIATAAASVVALLVSAVLARQIVQPIRRVLAASRRIAAGHYAERVPVAPANASDEVGQLAASFNEMAGALEQTEHRRLALVGDVAHELRTPIATLEGYLEGLLDGVIAPSAQTWAKLHDEARRLHRLVDDLQELSRAEAGQIPLVLRPIPAAVIVEAALDRLGAQFAEKGLDLHHDLPPQVPAVLADRDRAVQVLTNLLTNALRYTPAPGTITVRVAQRGDAVAVSVADTGIGLTPEQMAHLFERFYRVDKSRSRALGGSGIGLTIAKALVEAMGGTLQVQSAGLGQGSTFTFTLPVAAPHEHHLS
jgi:signal transduction histidine kinase